MVFEGDKTPGLTPVSGGGKVNVCSFVDSRQIMMVILCKLKWELFVWFILLLLRQSSPFYHNSLIYTESVHFSWN